MIEQRCRELLETVSFASLTTEEQERLIVLLSHDIAMAAKGSETDFVRTLRDNELLDEPLAENRGAKYTAKYTLFGQSAKSLSTDDAAAQNAMAVTASLREDFVNGTHPGAVIFPLVLAEAERNALPMERMLDAAATGLKLSMLLLDVYGKAAAEKGYRATTFINTIAGAAALSVAQGASTDDTMAAMAAAAGMVQGMAFPFQEGTEEWLVQVPLVAHAASLACKNAKALHFRHDNFLSGKQSLGSLLGVGTNAPLPENLSLTRIGVKRHPVNSFVQPVVEAVLRLKDVKSEDIEAVRVTVPQSFKAMPTLLNYGPLSSPNLGLLSIPISTALALLQKRLDFADFRMSNNPEVFALANKVQVEFESRLSQYDVEVLVQMRHGQAPDQASERASAVDTAFFYPSLADEIAWIHEQYSQPLPWLEQLLNWYHQR